MARASSLLVLVAFTRLALSYETLYWYSPVKDGCQYGKTTMLANDNSAHGAVCAYSPDTVRLYACPAPDPYCWTGTQSCKAGGNKAGPDQILCDNYDTQWCCTADETCTVTSGQVNVCISNFTSPNAKVNLNDANKKALAALGVSSIAATTQKSNPTPFSTQTFYTTDLPTSSASSSSPSAPATTSAPSATSSSSPVTTSSRSRTSTSSHSKSLTATATTGPSSSTVNSTGASATTADASESKSQSSGPSISAGGIVGIAIAVVFLLLMVAVAFFTLGRRKLKKARLHHAGPPPPPPKYAYSSLPDQQGTMSTVYTGYYDQKTRQRVDFMELPQQNGARSELSSSDGPPQRYELGH